MQPADLLNGSAFHFVEGQNRGLARAWSAFLGSAVFLKSSRVQALPTSELVKTFDRTVSVFEIELGGMVTGKIAWILDFRQIFHILRQLMRCEVDSNRQPDELSPDEIQGLEGIAHQGVKVMIRSLLSQDELELNSISSSVSFYQPEEIESLASSFSNNHCHVVYSDFEIFGSPGSVMVTVFSGDVTKQLQAWYQARVSDTTLRNWCPQEQPKFQILVADGSDENRRELQVILDDFLVDVFVAKNGEEAVYLTEKNVIDLIFCDVHMLKVSGVEFARWLRQRPENKRTPLIFCGQIPTRETLVEAKRAGIDEFVVKPPEPEKIHDLMLKYLPGAIS